ncbi:MAG: hypothetical protein ACK53A_10255 [Gemmatimonadota bacterium]
MTATHGAGYPSRMTSDVRIEGMLGPPDVRAAFTALAAVPGVRRAHVEAGRAELEHDGPLDLAALADALAVVGLRVAGVTSRRTLPTVGPDEA